MASKSIGSLFIDIAARTAQLEQDMGKVRTILQGTAKDTKALSDGMQAGTDKMTAGMAKFGVAMLGAQSLVRVVARDMRDLINNIEDVPGLSPEVVETIQTLRHNLEQAKRSFNEAIATEISWGVKVGQSLGVIAEAMSRAQGVSGLGDRLKDTWEGKNNEKLTPDELARDRDPHFDAKVKAADKRLAEAERKSQTAGLDEGAKANEQWKEYLELLNQTDTSKKNSLEIDELKIQAEHLYAEAVTRTGRLQREISDLTDKDDRVIAQRADIFENKQTKLNDLVAQRNALEQQYQALLNKNGVAEGAAQDKAVRLARQKVELDIQINTAMRRNGELYHELGTAIADDFTAAIVKGQRLGDVLRSLAQDIESIILKRLIAAPIASAITSGLGMLFGGKYADGGDPPMGKVSLVGENGPELFVPKSAGTIIPNGGVKSGSGGSSGSTFIIDARSADRTGLDRLTAMIRQVNGSIEYRAVAAVASAQGRRP